MHQKMLFNLIIILSSFFLGTSAWSVEGSEWTPNNWSIVVSSCDKYSALWQPFFTALESNWPELNSSNKNIGIYLIANVKQYNNARVKTLNIPNERSWSDNMLSALEKIDSKYILLFLEDYWVTELDRKRLMELMKWFEAEDAAYMELLGDVRFYGKDQKLSKLEGVVYKGKFQNYRTSLQLALWEKKALQQLLRSGEDIWAFELASSIRSSGYPKPFLGVTAKRPISYLNAVYQGHITPLALEFLQQQGIPFSTDLPVLGKYNWGLFWQGVKHKVRRVGGLVKRHVPGSQSNSYLYFFDE